VAYGSVTAVQGRQRGEGECPVTPDFLDAIDFLSNGELLALATYADTNGQNEVSGVHRINLATRTRSLVMAVGSETRSLSVLRGTDEGDISSVWVTGRHRRGTASNCTVSRRRGGSRRL
jgi:hypothetical protein